MAGLLGRFIGGAAKGATELADTYIAKREAGALAQLQADIEEQKQMRIAENNERLRREGARFNLELETDPKTTAARVTAESGLIAGTSRAKADAAAESKKAEYYATPQTFSEGQIIINPDGTTTRIPKTQAPGAADASMKEQRAATKAALDSVTRDIAALRRERAATYDEAVAAEIDAQLKAMSKEADGYRRALGAVGLDVPEGQEDIVPPPKPFDPKDFPLGGKEAGAKQPSADQPQTMAVEEKKRPAALDDPGGKKYMEQSKAIQAQFDIDIKTLSPKELKDKYVNNKLFRKLSQDRAKAWARKVSAVSN